MQTSTFSELPSGSVLAKSLTSFAAPATSPSLIRSWAAAITRDAPVHPASVPAVTVAAALAGGDRGRGSWMAFSSGACGGAEDHGGLRGDGEYLHSKFDADG